MKKLGREILNLAIPATLEHILETLVGFLDTWMISSFSLVAVTAVGLANSVLNVYLAVFLAVGIGVTTLVSQSMGSKNLPEARQAVQQGVVLGLSISFILTLLAFFFGENLLLWLGVDEEVLAGSLIFLQIVAASSFAQALIVIFSSILRARGDSRTPLRANLVANLVNVVLDYLLIFGWTFIPSLGILGTAIGTVISRLIATILLYRSLQKTDLALSIKDWAGFRSYGKILGLILPATLERLAMRLGQVLYFGFITVLGTKVFAAHSIAGSIEAFTYMPAYGLATAASVLVGTNLGAKNYGRARQAGFLSSLYGVFFMSFLGIILFFGAESFAGLFTQDREAIRQVVIALHIDAFAQPVLATSLIMAGALQGLGDTKTPFYTTLCGMWGVRIVGVLVLAQYFQLGIAGVWLSILLDLTLRSLLLVKIFDKRLKIYSS